LSGGFRKQLIQRSFLERHYAQNLQKSVKRKLQRQPLLDDRHKDINRDGDPNLGPHRVLGCSIESFDPQVLFDPTEKQFDLPAKFVEHGDGQRRKKKIIRQKSEITVVLPVVVADPAELVGVILAGLNSGENDRLVAGQVHGFIDGSRIDATGLEVRLGADDKKGPAQMKGKKPREVEVAPVENIEATGLGNEIVQNPHVVRFSIRHLDKRRDRTPQIEKGMELDGAFAFAEKGPGKKRQTEVDGSRVEGVDGVFEFQTKILVGVKTTGLGNEDLSKIGVNVPIALFVGVSQGVPRNTATDAHVIEAILHRSQTGLDIAETFAVRQLSEGQTEELIETGETFDLVIPAVAPDAFSEFVKRQKIRDLGEDCRRRIHRSLLSVEGQKSDHNTKSRLNRLRRKSVVTYDICT